MNEELNPCPFCGSPAFMWRWNYGVAIQCSKFDPKQHLVQMEGRDEEEVIKAWNGRASDETEKNDI